MVFYIPPQILDWRFMPIVNSPGPFYFCRSQQAKFYASFRRHYLDFLALIPLKKNFVARRIDYQMACWRIRDTCWKSRTNLLGKHLPMTWKYTGSHLTQMFFWQVFGAYRSFNLMRKSHSNWNYFSHEIISVTVFLESSGQGTNCQNRESLVSSD